MRSPPANHGIAGNEKAEEYAKAVAERGAPCSDGVTDESRWGTNLSHMTGAVTEARTRTTSE